MGVCECVCICVGPSIARLALLPQDRSSLNLVSRHFSSLAVEGGRDWGCISRPFRGRNRGPTFIFYWALASTAAVAEEGVPEGRGGESDEVLTHPTSKLKKKKKPNLCEDFDMTKNGGAECVDGSADDSMESSACCTHIDLYTGTHIEKE